MRGLRGACFAVITWLWPCLSGAMDRGSMPVHLYSAAEIGHPAQGWSAVQVDDGSVLFGFDVLSEFDGHAWRHSPIADTYALRALAPKRGGGVWVGGIDQIGWADRAPDGQWVFTSLLPRLPAGTGRIGDVWGVAEDRAGVVFATADRVLRWDGQHVQAWPLPGARRLVLFKDGETIYVGHRQHGLLRVGVDGLVTVLDATACGGESVHAVVSEPGRPTLYVSDRGLRQLEGGRLRPVFPVIDKWVQEAVLTSVRRLRDGRLALGSLRDGVALVDRATGQLQVARPGEDLPTGAIFSLFQDRDGDLWATSPSRVLRLRPEVFATHFEPAAAGGFPPLAIASDGSRVMVLTETGLWETSAKASEQPAGLTRIEGWREHARALLPLGNALLVGGRGGVWRLEATGEVRRIYETRSDIFALAELAPGVLALADERQVMVLPAGRPARLLAKVADPPTSLVVLPDETVVAGTSASGISVVGASAPRVQPLVQAVAQERGVTLVARVGEWVAAARGSRLTALHLPTGAIFRGPPVEGLEIKAMAPGRESHLWVVGMATDGRGKARPVLQRVREQNGALQGDTLDARGLVAAGGVTTLHAAVAPDGEEILWVGGHERLVRLEASHLRPAVPPPAPRLTVLETSTRRVKVRVDGLGPSGWSEHRMEYRIPELDLPWQVGGAGREFEWPGLRAGRFTLQARFLSPDNHYSGVTQVEVRVPPPWWWSGAARAAYVVIALAAFAAAWRARERVLRRRAARLERLVAERTAELRRASEAKSEFVANVSHEIRNPLNAIVASVHAMDEARLAPAERKLLTGLRHSAELLDRLIGDVLDFSAVESRRLDLQRVPFAPREALAAVVEMVRPRALAKDLALRAEFGGLPARLLGDSVRIQQVVTNLLSNAVKFSQRGEIVLTADASPLDDGQFRLTISVADDGPGITPEDQAKLFTKFTRLRPAAGVGGTGLGLALSKELVEAMGGRIWVRSTPGVGSTFIFELQLGGPGASLFPAPTAGKTALPETALVVDDLEYNTEALVILLGRMGIRATAAGTGAQAVRRVEDLRPPVVFLDWVLPDMLAPEVMRLIRASVRPPPRFVITTAHVDEATRAEALRGGAVAFVAKPLTPEKLLAALQGAEQHAQLPAAPRDVAPAGLDFRQLRLVSGDEHEFATKRQLLAGLIQEDTRLLQGALSDGDAVKVARLAHTLASHGAFVGAARIQQLAQRVQQATGDGLAEAVSQLVEEAERVGGQLSETSHEPEQTKPHN